MLASQSIVPIAGIWPWGTFLTALKPGATSGDVARDIAEQLALFLETPANRDPFADVPYSLIDLGAAGAIAEPLKALADALDAARTDAARRPACAAALEAARVGFPNDQAAPGDPALLDVPTMCEQPGEARARPGGRTGAGARRRRRAPAGDLAPLTAGPAPGDRPLLPAGEGRSTPTGRTCTRKALAEWDADALPAAGPEPGHGVGSDRARSAAVRRRRRARRPRAWLRWPPCVLTALALLRGSSWRPPSSRPLLARLLGGRLRRSVRPIRRHPACLVACSSCVVTSSCAAV